MVFIHTTDNDYQCYQPYVTAQDTVQLAELSSLTWSLYTSPTTIYSYIFKHVARLPDNIPAHQAMLHQVELSVGRPPDPTRKRPPGRPCTKWTDQLLFYEETEVLWLTRWMWCLLQSKGSWMTICVKCLILTGVWKTKTEKYCRLVERRWCFQGMQLIWEMYVSSVTGSETNSGCRDASASEYKRRLVMLLIHIRTIWVKTVFWLNKGFRNKGLLLETTDHVCDGKQTLADLDKLLHQRRKYSNTETALGNTSATNPTSTAWFRRAGSSARAETCKLYLAETSVTTTSLYFHVVNMLSLCSVCDCLWRGEVFSFCSEWQRSRRCIRVADDIVQLRRQGVKMHQPETAFTTSPSATAADAAAEEASNAGGWLLRHQYLWPVQTRLQWDAAEQNCWSGLTFRWGVPNIVDDMDVTQTLCIPCKQHTNHCHCGSTMTAVVTHETLFMGDSLWGSHLHKL